MMTLYKISFRSMIVWLFSCTEYNKITKDMKKNDKFISRQRDSKTIEAEILE